MIGLGTSSNWIFQEVAQILTSRIKSKEFEKLRCLMKGMKLHYKDEYADVYITQFLYPRIHTR